MFTARFTPTRPDGSEGEAQDVVPQAQDVAGRGVVRIPGQGRLTLTFSNAHSRFRRKTVSLRMRGDLTAPEVGPAAVVGV